MFHVCMCEGILQSKVENIPVDDESFDAVIGTLVLCSVSDVSSAMREILRTLKPGGKYLFIEVCDVQIAWDWWRVFEKLLNSALLVACRGSCRKHRSFLAGRTQPTAKFCCWWYTFYIKCWVTAPWVPYPGKPSCLPYAACTGCNLNRETSTFIEAAGFYEVQNPCGSKILLASRVSCPIVLILSKS